MIGRVAILAGLLSLACAFRDQKQQQQIGREAASIDTVTSLNVPAFLGRWYQMYGSVSSTLLTFGNAGPQDTCVSADYFLNDEDGTTIEVLNQGLRGDTGAVTKIWGQAKATSKPGQRKLTFSKFLRGDKEVTPPDFEGDYWIYTLGPIVDGKYAFAVVGGPLKPSWGFDKTQLFVLARDPTSWSDLYDDMVMDWLKANGFSWWWNKPRKTGSVGPFKWLPYPGFTKADPIRGEFGQTGCASVEGLTKPPGDETDPRV